MLKKVVFTSGCFDIFHYGHLYLLREASYLGNYLIVGINSDTSIKKLKGNNRPIFPLIYRRQIISSLSFVDDVIPFNEKTPLNLIKKIKPDVLVKGGNYNHHKIVGSKFVQSYGGKVKIISLIKDLSTTLIIEKLEGK